jgi:hypothetical protein
MVREAATTGFYESGGQKVPQLQILTAQDVLDDKRPRGPFGHTEGFRKAAREADDQTGLFDTSANDAAAHPMAADPEALPLEPPPRKRKGQPAGL